MNKGGVLIYRCRRCGERIANTHAPDIHHALICLISDIPLPEKWFGVPVSKLELHHCADKFYGVADLIGGKED